MDMGSQHVFSNFYCSSPPIRLTQRQVLQNLEVWKAVDVWYAAVEVILYMGVEPKIGFFTPQIIHV